ncbi:MAG: 30S ribosomal protein S11 [Patescibacteria group bacterium]
MGKKKVIQKSEEVKSEALPKSGPKEVSESRKNKIEKGRVYIQASYNNTLISVTDEKGNLITWVSAGSLGFSGPKKSTPFAASKVAEAVATKVERSLPMNVEVFLRGVGAGRDSALRTLAAKGFNITSVRDVTPIPHNGPRPPKVRRV